MDDDRKRKEDNKWSIGLGIAAGIAGAGLLAGLGYKIWKHVKDEQYLDIGDIGVNFNDWRKPKALSFSDMIIATKLCDASTSELDIGSTDWEKATGAVNKVLGLLMVEIRKEARKYEGLVIEKYVKQGSSREGLKVYAADEFDVLLQYHFEGLEYEVENISPYGNILPELAYLRVNSTMSQLSRTHPRLYMKGVFTEMDGEPYINTRNFQEKVFTSLIATAASVVEGKVNEGEYMEELEFRIKIRTNPPSVNIGIELTDEENIYSAIQRLGEIILESSEGAVGGKEAFRSKSKTVIDVDIVPGLLKSEDRVPDPTNKKRTMLCPTYAVFKWLTENHRSASRYGAKPALLWRICSSGYEKHVIDVAQGKLQQQHIVNALRFLKLYFRNMKKRAIERKEPPPQVVTVLRSYHLKHIALYCILFLRVLNNVHVSDVQVALAYMLAFLEVCLDERKLPHFFHANENITSMFPDFKRERRALRYDLFQGKVGESFNQAIRSYRLMKDKMSRVIISSGTEMGTLVTDDIVNEFRVYVLSGQYYQ